MRYWFNLYTPKTWNAFFEAGCPAHASFPESAGKRVAEMRPGDLLIGYIGSPVCGFMMLQEVSGEPYHDPQAWGGEAYPHVVPVRNLAVLDQKCALPYRSFEALPLMRSKSGGMVPNRGFVGSTGRKIDADVGREIADALLNAADVSEPEPARAPEVPEPEATEAPNGTHGPDLEGPSEPADGSDEPMTSSHLATQDLLVRLGHALGLNVWVARNDKSRYVNNLRLGDAPGVMDEFPSIFADDRAQSTIELIDILWMRRGECVAAFEVECTTAVYSGILRMSDLMTLQPNIRIPLYIVAPEKRRKKVQLEVTRPTFEFGPTRPMREVCRYIPMERLQEIEQIPHDLWRNLNHGILETRSEEIPARD